MEFRHYELGRQLVRMGHTVVVISGSYSHLFTKAPRTTGTYSLEEIDGVHYCWVKVPSYHRPTSIGRVLNMLAFAIRLLRVPVRRLPQPDAIVVSSPSLFPLLPAERWSRRWRARLVFEVRDVWPLTLQELGGLSRFHPLIALMGWFENRAYRVADDVVSVLPAARAHLEAHGMAPAKLTIIPNGVSAEALERPGRSVPARVKAAASRHRFTVGFLGTLGLANALDALIDAARLLSDTDIGFVLVGQGSDGERLRATSADLPNVAFVGPVPIHDVPGALEAFDVCYVGYHDSPLYRFGISPNKVFAYMAASRPIILAASAANDPVRDAECGLTVPPDDPTALAAAIRAIEAMTPAERIRLGVNGREYVERVHAYPSLARQYEKVLAGTEP
jgi:glycosyltransferase involved in cell wall biosynthesis